MKCNFFHCPDPGFSRLYIFGAGGFGREVAWLAEQCWGDRVEVFFLVDQRAYLTPPVNGVQVQLVDEVTAREEDRFVVALGDPGLRRKATLTCQEAGLQPTCLVHPRAEISARVVLSQGSIVCGGSILTTDIVVGAHVHVNLACTIGHDVQIGDYTTLSPGVHVSGNVEIGEDVFIGTGANIINGSAGAPLVIGRGAVIAAGACVTRPVEPGALVAGVPAVRKR
ncbi:acetyltransferase [Pseudoxanthomonas koreensis]|uniref:acetyltransferase n=1 Tax=Pseudoxanthomonas koreensis TaxID=266061 RepID=UPI001390CE16|nr:acetyltransferase [Pseudoxanthomonas koreensis]KAF1695300.1 acetyltransferase [Pseudoxanthomonas koreensis]